MIYFNEYDLAWQSIRRIILHNNITSLLGAYSTNIISGYSVWVSVVIESYIMWEVKNALLCFQKEIKLASIGGMDTQTGE